MSRNDVRLTAPTTARPLAVFGEAMIELSGITERSCTLGVAGDTFNTAVYLRRFGWPVEYVTALGDDPFSQRIRDALTSEGIGAGHVLRHARRSPGLYAVNLDSSGERSFTYWRDTSAARAFFEASGSETAMHWIGGAGALYLSGISLSLFDRDGHEQLARAAAAVRERGGLVIFDTNYRPHGWPDPAAARQAVETFAPFVSIALPTFEDEALLFGDSAPEDTSRRWLEAGAEEVVVKHGAEGALLGGSEWVPVPNPETPVDTTGAGDAFNAAYLAARFEGAGPVTAARHGHALASSVLGTYGAILPRGEHPLRRAQALLGSLGDGT